MIRIGLTIAFGLVLAACGSVSSDADARLAGGDGPPQDGPPGIDADPCAPFTAPPGSRLLHDAFCFDALGFNPTASPTSMPLACPGAGTTPGTYGLIRRPAMGQQADGCAATTPLTRITAPAADTALTQTGTNQNLAISAGERFRVRLSCAAQDAATCRGQVQITGRAVAGGPITLVYPAQGLQELTGEATLDVDVPFPPALEGPSTRLVLIVRSVGVDAPDILFENPHITQ